MKVLNKSETEFVSGGIIKGPVKIIVIPPCSIVFPLRPIDPKSLLY